MRARATHAAALPKAGSDSGIPAPEDRIFPANKWRASPWRRSLASSQHGKDVPSTARAGSWGRGRSSGTEGRPSVPGGRLILRESQRTWPSSADPPHPPHIGREATRVMLAASGSLEQKPGLVAGPKAERPGENHPSSGYPRRWSPYHVLFIGQNIFRRPPGLPVAVLEQVHHYEHRSRGDQVYAHLTCSRPGKTSSPARTDRLPWRPWPSGLDSPSPLWSRRTRREPGEGEDRPGQDPLPAVRHRDPPGRDRCWKDPAPAPNTAAVRRRPRKLRGRAVALVKAADRRGEYGGVPDHYQPGPKRPGHLHPTGQGDLSSEQKEAYQGEAIRARSARSPGMPSRPWAACGYRRRRCRRR